MGSFDKPGYINITVKVLCVLGLCTRQCCCQSIVWLGSVYMASLHCGGAQQSLSCGLEPES